MQLPYLHPFATLAHSPSNIPTHGFHPETERHLGYPNVPRSYDIAQPRPSKDKVDDHQYSSYNRGDLSLRYTYEVATEFNLGGEFVTLPVIIHVYRRDFELLWSEIKSFLIGGDVPARYGPRITPDGVVHEPMNEESFRKLVRRFYIISTLGVSEFPLTPKHWLMERGSRWAVQLDHDEFEWVYNRQILWVYGRREILTWTPERLLGAVTDITHTWYLDRIPRVRAAFRDLRFNY